MTSEEIDAIEAGTGLDILIAKNIFSWRDETIVDTIWVIPPEYNKNSVPATFPIRPPHYSTDVREAWKIVDALVPTIRHNFFSIEKHVLGYGRDDDYKASFLLPDGWAYSCGKTPAIAICKAGLKVIMTERGN